MLYKWTISGLRVSVSAVQVDHQWMESQQNAVNSTTPYIQVLH